MKPKNAVKYLRHYIQNELITFLSEHAEKVIFIKSNKTYFFYLLLTCN